MSVLPQLSLAVFKSMILCLNPNGCGQQIISCHCSSVNMLVGLYLIYFFLFLYLIFCVSTPWLTQILFVLDSQSQIFFSAELLSWIPFIFMQLISPTKFHPLPKFLLSNHALPSSFMSYTYSHQLFRDTFKINREALLSSSQVVREQLQSNERRTQSSRSPKL